MIMFNLLDIVLFIVFAINVAYLVLFSVASLFEVRRHTKVVGDCPEKRVAILIPAYREDAVIVECVESSLAQQYPSHMYDVVVISDRMSAQTNELLSGMDGVTLIEVHFENSTKSKALNHAMSQLDKAYDIALVLDADNTIAPDFLSQVNDIFSQPDVRIVQAHRCAKNTNNPLALLDAVSEEINNNIFRKGHVNLGLSAALIGSGMCFDYQLFKTTMNSIDAIGGFDRALELVLLRQGHHVHYLAHADVLDEKVQRQQDFASQRRRWLSAQLHYMVSNLKYVPSAIADRKWDFCDKVFQQMSIPRVMLMGFITIMALVVSFINFSAAIKWWAILALLTAALTIAVPRKLLIKKELILATLQVPYFFTLMVMNLFRLRGANKKFIHTKHGLKK